MIKNAELYLNGCLVGRIRIKRLMGAWGFGEFVPTRAFAAFRAVYDQWALLMHTDAEGPLNGSTALALSQVEFAMDRIHGQLLLDNGDWRAIAQLTIDGDLIEWEERYAVTATDRRIAAAHERIERNRPARNGLEFAN